MIGDLTAVFVIHEAVAEPSAYGQCRFLLTRHLLLFVGGTMKDALAALLSELGATGI